MERLRIKIRKKLWLTLSATPGHERNAFAMLFVRLATARQHAYIVKSIGHPGSAGDVGEYRRKDGKIICSVRLTWTAGTTIEQYIEMCDWLGLVVFQTSRKGTFADLREALSA